MVLLLSRVVPTPSSASAMILRSSMRRSRPPPLLRKCSMAWYGGEAEGGAGFPRRPPPLFERPGSLHGLDAVAATLDDHHAVQPRLGGLCDVRDQALHAVLRRR